MKVNTENGNRNPNKFNVVFFKDYDGKTTMVVVTREQWLRMNP